jgi:uncharacterized membrane protein
MFIRAPEAHSRSLLKAISWRALGSIDTFVISFFVTHHFAAAASIASVETFTKIMLFYAHERAWTAVSWGRGPVVEADATAPAAQAEVPSAAPAADPALA